jgi:HSP20 family protein
MRLVTYHPFRSLQQEINRMFDDVFSDRETEGAAGWYPTVDVTEEKDAFVIHAELPGVKSEDIKLRMSNSVLILAGEKKQEHRTEQENYYRMERAYGAFQRSFNFPAIVDPDNISAEFKDGVLVVRVPKKETAQVKEIPFSLN